MRLRTQLVLLVACAILPVAVFAGIMTARFWDLQRDAYGQQFLERVRALRIALDTELDATLRTLRALSESDDFTTPAFDGIGRRLGDLERAHAGWEAMGVLLPDGTPVVQELRQPSPVLIPSAATVAKVVNSKAPFISDLEASGNPPRYTTYVAMPVVRNDVVRYVLYVGIDHAAWLAFLQKYPITARATLTLNDRNGKVIARTLNDDRWVGKTSSPEFFDRTRVKYEDSFRSKGLEGQAFYSAFSHLSASGWTLGTGVPQDEVESALLGSSLWVFFGVVGASLVALVLAFLIGARISGDIKWLSVFAKNMASPDHAPEPRRLRMTEAASVRTTLEETDRLLRERQATLSDAIAREATARATAENANQAKDRFLAMLGHELRNPLSAISTAAALLQTKGAAKHLAKSTEIISRQVRHLTAMVNELLDVARITSGKVVLAKVNLDIAAVARRVVAVMEDSGRAAAGRIRCELDEAHVYADETRLEQIITNLIDNALKYSSNDTEIKVTVRPSDEEAILEVRDNGKGVAPQLLPRIFDLFEQGERAIDRAEGGLGVGLTVVRALVERHGGSIEGTSAGPGRGFIATVRLPRVEALSPPAAGPLPLQVAPQRILVVDDNADIRNSLSTLLRARGHHVVVANDGPQAVAMFVSNPPEIAIVDVGLPGYDGLEVARRVRARADFRGIPLIALSGYGSDHDRAAAVEAGFDDYMVKPFDHDRFDALLARLLPESRARLA